MTASTADRRHVCSIPPVGGPLDWTCPTCRTRVVVVRSGPDGSLQVTVTPSRPERRGRVDHYSGPRMPWPTGRRWAR